MVNSCDNVILGINYSYSMLTPGGKVTAPISDKAGAYFHLSLRESNFTETAAFTV